jgi:hypothetical protein
MFLGLPDKDPEPLVRFMDPDPALKGIEGTETMLAK